MEESIKSLVDQINHVFKVEKPDLRQYSGLALAYIGDGIYDLVIRTLFVEKGNAPVNTFHKKTSKIVKAETQAQLVHAIEGEFSEEELSIYKRGRNAKSFTSAKNASVMDYRVATGFEALIGYLYLDNQMERILELIKLGLEKIGESI